MASNSLNIIPRAREIQKNIPSMEYELGKGLLQPFNNTNSGARKILQGIQREQAIQILNSETPLVMTGFENQFGEYSSSFTRADSNYEVIAKVYKHPNNYWVLAYDVMNGVLNAYHRISYAHVTEMFGYSLNTDYLDHINVGQKIKKGDVVIRADAFDNALNKCDGVNLTTIYLAFGLTTEDPIVLSESAAKKIVSPLFDNISIMINENDIPLNLYGDNENYKSFPDIGEKVKNGIFCAIRQERKDDEALYSQTSERLQHLMMSDDMYIANGEGIVEDIDIYCNSIEKLDAIYNSQLAKVYERQMKFCTDMAFTVEKFLAKHPKVQMSYDLQKIYSKCKDCVNGVQFIRDNVFNNILLDVMIREDKSIEIGDKVTDRYGGKGVISYIMPDELMPMYERFGELRPVDAIYNSSTIVNRENPGQSFETEITFVGEKIVEAISKVWPQIFHENDIAALEASELAIYTYLNILSPKEAEFYKEEILIRNKDDIDARKSYIMDVVNTGGIYLVVEPISANMNIEVLRRLYAAFPWIDMDDLYVVQKDSNGQYRRIKSRRKIITGKKYIYRLKQIAKEKFSAVSLASTNIRSENTKTKANKMHRSAIPKTPVRFGDMEITNLSHADVARLVSVIMLLSSSPTARRLNEKLLTGDPFDINIKLDSSSKSRAVEIVNAYLKTMGIRLTFRKVEDNKVCPFLIVPFDVHEPAKPEPFRMIPNYVNQDDYHKMKDILNNTLSSEENESAKTEKVEAVLTDLMGNSFSMDELMEKVEKFTPSDIKVNPFLVTPFRVFSFEEDESNESRPDENSGNTDKSTESEN